MNKISSCLDHMADALEEAGLIREAAEVDKHSNTIEYIASMYGSFDEPIMNRLEDVSTYLESLLNNLVPFKKKLYDLGSEKLKAIYNKNDKEILVLLEKTKKLFAEGQRPLLALKKLLTEEAKIPSISEIK